MDEGQRAACQGRHLHLGIQRFVDKVSPEALSKIFCLLLGCEAECWVIENATPNVPIRTTQTKIARQPYMSRHICSP